MSAGYYDDDVMWRPWPSRPLPPLPMHAQVEGLCWAAKEPRVFPTWHYSTARYRGSVWRPAWPMVMDRDEPMRRSKLYDEHGTRSPLLERGVWALEVRGYAPSR